MSAATSSKDRPGRRRGRRRWERVVGLVAVAVLAATLAVVPAGAETADAPGGEVAVPVGDGDTEVPAPIRATSRPPVGAEYPRAPLPADAGEAVEVPELRTETSRTFAEGNGEMVTEISATPMHYFDGDAWQPITEGWAPAADGTWRSAGGALEVTVDPDGVAPVTVATDAGSLRFSLAGADPAAGEAILDPVEAELSVDEVRPGVEARYAWDGVALKEDLVVDSPAAWPAGGFWFDVSAVGLVLRPAAEGADIEIVAAGDAETVLARIPAPVAFDQAALTGGVDEKSLDAAEAGTTTGTWALEPVAGGYRLGAVMDEAWVRSPERVWPVILDPTVSTGWSVEDTYLSPDNTTANYGASSVLRVGATNSTNRRTLVRFNVPDVISDAAVVRTAKMELYLQSGPSVAQSLAAAAANKFWVESEATWVRAKAGTNWNNGGGDESGVDDNTSVDNTAGYKTFWVTDAVQRALDDGGRDMGALVRYAAAGGGGEFVFSSSEGANPPKLEVRWDEPTGIQDRFTYVNFALTPTESARVNVGSGNLTVTARDLDLEALGPKAAFDRFYDSDANPAYGFGMGEAVWAAFPGPVVALEEQSDGDMILRGGPSRAIHFSKNYDGTGGWRSPAGVRARLSKSGGTYSLFLGEMGETWTFNSSLLITDRKNRDGQGFSYTYKTQNGQTVVDTVIDGYNRVYTFFYDNVTGGVRLKQMKDFSNRYTNYAYTSGNRLNRVTYPDGTYTAYTYEGTSTRLDTMKDRRNNETRFDYNGSVIRRVERVEGGQVRTWTFTFDRTGNRANAGSVSPGNWSTTVTDPRGNDTVYYVDGTGQVVQVKDAQNKVRDLSYNNGFVASATPDGQGTTTITYNADSTIADMSLPSGAATTFQYSGTQPGNEYLPSEATETNASGGSGGTSSRFTYDNAGHLTMVRDASDNSVTAEFTYTTGNENAVDGGKMPKGLVYQRKLPGVGVTDTYKYDNLGRLRRIEPAATAHAVTTISYDNRDRTSLVVDGNGRRLYAYQASTDRLAQVTVQNASSVTQATYSYGYDAVGNMTQLTGPVGGSTQTTTWAFDAFNRVSSITGPGAAGTVSYAYDPAGNLSVLTTGGNHTRTYTYNNRNEATSIVYQAPSTANQTYTLTYRGDGQVNTVTYPNGVVTTYHYDQNGQRDEIDTVKGSTVIVDESVRYSGTGGDGHRVGYLIERAPAPAVRVDYAYDSRGRLTGAVTKNNSTGSTVSNYSYTYDAASNRLTAKLGSTTNTFTYNTVTSRVTADSGGSYGYDAAKAGNLVSSPGFSALGYNNAGQLTSADPVGSQQATTVAYNGPDANWEHSLTTPGGYGVTLTQSTLGAVRAREGTADTDYVRAPSGMLLGQHGNLLGQTAASTNRFYHHNHHGDVVAVTNGSGGVTDTWTYSPYGETVAHTGNMRTPFGWSAAAGYTTHESGLIHAGARYYQPRSGTWTQPDPQPDQPAYLYAGGDPINNTDPTGQFLDDVVDFASDVVTGAGVGATAGLLGGLALCVTTGVGCVVAGAAGAGAFSAAGGVIGAAGGAVYSAVT